MFPPTRSNWGAVFILICITGCTRLQSNWLSLAPANSLESLSAFRLKLSAEQTIEPLAGVEVFRIDRRPDSEKGLSGAIDGDNKTLETKLGTTNKLGIITLSNEHRKAQLICRTKSGIMSINLANKTASYGSNTGSSFLKLHRVREDEPNQLELLVPTY